MDELVVDIKKHLHVFYRLFSVINENHQNDFQLLLLMIFYIGADPVFEYQQH
jgi:hypothetical protein